MKLIVNLYIDHTNLNCYAVVNKIDGGQFFRSDIILKSTRLKTVKKIGLSANEKQINADMASNERIKIKNNEIATNEVIKDHLKKLFNKQTGYGQTSVVCHEIPVCTHKTTTQASIDVRTS